MTDFHRLHAALFDELDRQGVARVDVTSLARAVAGRFHLAAVDPLGLARPPSRCANGACDE